MLLTVDLGTSATKAVLWDHDGPVAMGRAPRQVPSVSNFKISGANAITGLVGGGVVLNPMQTVRTAKFEKDEKAKDLKLNTVCSVVFHPCINEWNGRRDVHAPGCGEIGTKF